MLAQSLRASRSSLARAVRRPNATAFHRTIIIPTAVRQADMVQDMYLKELKAYKAPAEKAGDADAHVQKFSMPQAPKSPEETDIQNDLKAYEEQVPEVEGQAGSEGSGSVEKDWFEEPEEEDDDHGHH